MQSHLPFKSIRWWAGIERKERYISGSTRIETLKELGQFSVQIFCLSHEMLKAERFLVKPSLSKRLNHKGDSTYSPGVTAQVKNRSLLIAQQCSSQVAKYMFAQIINFKKADYCQAALHTEIFKT